MSLQTELQLPPLSPRDEVFGDGGHDGEAVSLKEYLATAYHPDCEYVDGHLEERNLGELDHARLQLRLLALFLASASEWQVEALPELRLQVSSTNFRVPDVMVLACGHTTERIVREAPLLCMEVLSPDDTWKRMGERIRDYLAMGVKHIWVFDAEAQAAFSCDAEGYHRVLSELAIEDTPIRIDLPALFDSRAR